MTSQRIAHLTKLHIKAQSSHATGNPMYMVYEKQITIQSTLCTMHYALCRGRKIDSNVNLLYKYYTQSFVKDTNEWIYVAKTSGLHNNKRPRIFLEKYI